MQDLIQALEYLVRVLPLHWFVLVISILDELFPPIPSPFAMVVAHAALVARQAPWWQYLVIVIIAGVGKTIASLWLYWLGDAGEDVVVGTFGRWLGIDKGRVQQFAAKLNRGWRDDVVIFITRLLPILPTTVVSLACGALQTDKRRFFWLTLVGMVLRNVIMLTLVYYGAAQFQELLEQLQADGVVPRE